MLSYICGPSTAQMRADSHDSLLCVIRNKRCGSVALPRFTSSPDPTLGYHVCTLLSMRGCADSWIGIELALERLSRQRGATGLEGRSVHAQTVVLGLVAGTKTRPRPKSERHIVATDTRVVKPLESVAAVLNMTTCQGRGSQNGPSSVLGSHTRHRNGSIQGWHWAK